MNQASSKARDVFPKGRVLATAGGLLSLTLGVGLISSCGAFNPAFVNTVTGDPATFATIDNAPGHVAITFINNAEVDERLVAFLESAEGGSLVLTDGEKRALRPRIRFRIDIIFANGEIMPVEFVSGSTTLVDPRFDALSEPDLNQNDLDNVVVFCDVAAIQIRPGSVIEVFIPVNLNQYEQVIVRDQNENIQTDFEFDQAFAPQFRQLQVDQTDADGNVVLRQNIGVRDVPSPVLQPNCGRVISIVLNGLLDVPFLAGVDDTPSYSVDDIQTVAGIGGRYEFVVSVD